MKGILKYNLPEEQEEFLTAQNGSTYKLILWELDQWLRNKIKYEDIDNIKTQEVRDKLHDLLLENGIEL